MSKPVAAAKAPIKVDVEAGETYWWCACGRSQTQPFCDGSHDGTGLEPMEYTAPADGEAWFCACKHTGHAPMCDGTHQTV